MKKLTKVFGLVVISVLTVIMAVCFAACQDGEKREEWETYAGTYKFSKMESTVQGSGVNQTFNVGVGESFGGLTFSENTMIIELKSDGKAVLTSDIASIQSQSNLDWRVEDGNLVFPEMSVSGLEITISDNTIEYGMTITVSGMTTTSKYILEKV